MILLYMVKIKYEVFFQVTTVLMKYKEEQKLPSPNISMEFFFSFSPISSRNCPIILMLKAN